MEWMLIRQRSFLPVGRILYLQLLKKQLWSPLNMLTYGREEAPGASSAERSRVITLPALMAASHTQKSCPRRATKFCLCIFYDKDESQWVESSRRLTQKNNTWGSAGFRRPISVFEEFHVVPASDLILVSALCLLGNKWDTASEINLCG